MSTPSETPTPAAPPPPRPQQATIRDAIQTISPLADLQALPSMPCARYSLLFGILAGTSVGVIRFLVNRSGGIHASLGALAQARIASNWAVGAWGVGSLGAWETCRRRQSAEAARMHAMVAEVKARRAALHKSKRIGGILLGEKGREVLVELEKEAREDDEKPWYRRWG